MQMGGSEADDAHLLRADIKVKASFKNTLVFCKCSSDLWERRALYLGSVHHESILPLFLRDWVRSPDGKYLHNSEVLGQSVQLC